MEPVGAATLRPVVCDLACPVEQKQHLPQAAAVPDVVQWEMTSQASPTELVLMR